MFVGTPHDCVIPPCAPTRTQGRKEEGILDCSAAIDTHPEWTKAYVLRAQTLMQLEKYEDAVRDYTHLAEGNPKGEVVCVFFSVQARAEMDVHLCCVA